MHQPEEEDVQMTSSETPNPDYTGAKRPRVNKPKIANSTTKPTTAPKKASKKLNAPPELIITQPPPPEPTTPLVTSDPSANLTLDESIAKIVKESLEKSMCYAFVNNKS